MSKKRIVITTGGTGGHIFPAHALAQQISKKAPEIEIVFMGGGLSGNAFFKQLNYPSKDITYSPIEQGLIGKVKSVYKILKGMKESRRILKDLRPSVVVGFGSFYTVPVLLAARSLSIPIVQHEANCVAGKVTRYFAPSAKVTCTHFPHTIGLKKGRTLAVGMPLREGYTSLLASREKAREYFQLDKEKLTFLVFGGSQGALTINTEFCSAAMELAEKTKNFQILHLTGTKGTAEETAAFYKDIGIQACVRPFEERMDLAWTCSDLTISRAGAVSIAEQIEFEVPGILIPFPYATDQHQEKNAEFMVDQVKGAEILREGQYEAKEFSSMMTAFVGHEREKLNEMKAAIQSYKHKQAGRDLCSVVCEVSGVNVR